MHQTAPSWDSYHLNIWAYISRKESQILRHSVHFWTIWILKFWGNLEKSWELLSHDSVINRWSPILVCRHCFTVDVRMPRLRSRIIRFPVTAPVEKLLEGWHYYKKWKKIQRNLSLYCFFFTIYQPSRVLQCFDLFIFK